MSTSDDEGEALPYTVSNYHFVDDKDEPISFSELPVQWNEGESQECKKKQIFLYGSVDNGLQKIYKQVIAWKFDLSDTKPEISVLSKENNWITLQKPRKSFEDMIRTILIAVHCLHYVKKNPETSGRALWDHLSKVFSLDQARPSENDLVDHIQLIAEAVKWDKSLRNSKFLVTFLEEPPMKRNAFDEDVGHTAKSDFIVDDDMIDEFDADESDEEGDLFDSVCAICDNGGSLLCCDGRCLRSFHPTVEDGADSNCVSLGLSAKQVKAMKDFFCKNCQYKQHQCFSCGELGSSDKLSGAEVFPCVSATCGRFYHPHCVAKLIHHESEAQTEKLQKRIAAGESFTCPVHKCCVCEQGENKMDSELQFAICRRCPKAYHRKCLPREIAFEDLEDEGIVQRAWEDLIPNRILIYCLEHEIKEDIRTPKRNHIKFPNIGQKKREQASDLLSSQEKVLPKKRSLASQDACWKGPVEKPQSSTIAQVDSSKRSEGRLFRSDSVKKQKVMDTSRKPLNKTALIKVSKPSTSKNISLGEKLYALASNGSKPVKSTKEDFTGSGYEETETKKPVAKEMDSSQPLDADTKRRMLALIKDAASSITMEQITKSHKMPTTHAYSSKTAVDKTINLGKVEGSIEALRAALLKLEEGCNIEDAKAVCETELLNQITKWKNKLRVYLAPFLYGLRYTSFGRHFTKVDILKEIVNVLHWYVQDGDMIVDFCCGSNDFSCLMKKKVDEMGKKCSFKNYDILQAKNDFNFEKRDWMSVNPKELPMGSQLIMGLNPPFGVNAALANKFIDKALEFKPKLLILIVPQETERLDKKKSPYDLVWEDDELLVGKPFYLPGSVDVNDKQMDDWNVNPPPLYLWSCPDWTAKHKAIAQQQGHLSRVREELHLEENYDGIHVSNFLVEDHDVNGVTSMPLDDRPVPKDEPNKFQEKGASMTGSHKEGLTHDNGHTGDNKNHGKGKNQSNENPKKRSHVKGKQGRGSGELSSMDRQNGHHSMPHHSPSIMAGGRSSDHHVPKPFKMPTNMEVARHFEPKSISESHLQFQTGYSGNRDDDVARRYSLNGEEPYSGLAHGWPHSGSPGPDYGFRNSVEQVMDYPRETIDTHGYGSYISEIDDKYGRESELRSQVRLYGQQDPDFSSRSSYYKSHESGLASYGQHLGLAADSSYNRMNTSAMQRYAPRLDELNHTRINSLGPEPLVSRNGIHDPLAPRPGFRADSVGFAPGPYRSFSQHNSSGWLNE